MAEIKKPAIVIASLLKPVDDTRMFEKMGMSLERSGKYSVHVIGYPSVAKAPSANGPTLHPLVRFSRLSIKRILSPLYVLKKVAVIKPAILIITTHELLFIALLARVFRRCCVIYDVRENYYRNILHTGTFPAIVRPLIATFVRAKEKLSRLFVDHYFLAERGYENEFTFTRDRATVIENKIVLTGIALPSRTKNQEDTLHFLFSGTLAETTGVFVAIDLVKAFHAINPAVRLTIIGYAAQRHVADRLKDAIQHSPFIQLTGGDTLVPHPQIIKAIVDADVGIIAYPPNPATANTIPTKLFEYLGLRLPVLLINHPPWVDFCAPYSAAISFDPGSYSSESLLNTLRTTKFYPGSVPPVSWESEEIKLLSAVQSLI